MEYIITMKTVLVLALTLSWLLYCEASPEAISENDVYGYTLEGGTVAGKYLYWSNRPIRVALNDCGGLDGCTAQHMQSLRDGLDLWRANASFFGEISIEETTSNPDVVFSWRQSFGSSVIGQCQFCIGVSSLGQLAAGRPWTVSMALDVVIDSETRKISQTGIKLVSAHEMGHCLGLFQHSPRQNDLMHAFLSSATDFTYRDVNTVRKLYSEPSDFASPANCSSFGSSGLQMTSPHVTYDPGFIE